jgi:hypothetical protein
VRKVRAPKTGRLRLGGLEQTTSEKMKTKSILLLTILTFSGLVTNRPAFCAPPPRRPLPAPQLRATPVPRSVATPRPAPAVDSIGITYETSAASNIAIAVTAGQSGMPAGFSIQWMTLADYVALGNQWPVTPEVPNAPAPSFCKANFSGIVPSLADEAEASRRVLESNSFSGTPPCHFRIKT